MKKYKPATLSLHFSTTMMEPLRCKGQQAVEQFLQFLAMLMTSKGIDDVGKLLGGAKDQMEPLGGNLFVKTTCISSTRSVTVKAGEMEP